MAEYQERKIGGLHGCQDYTVNVHYEYTHQVEDTKQLHISTTCTPQQHDIGTLHWKFTIVELIIILLSSLILLMGVVCLCFYLSRARRLYRLQQNTISYTDVVDVRDLNNFVSSN